jgi:hypothetical protein
MDNTQPNPSGLIGLKNNLFNMVKGLFSSAPTTPTTQSTPQSSSGFDFKSMVAKPGENTIYDQLRKAYIEKDRSYSSEYEKRNTSYDIKSGIDLTTDKLRGVKLPTQLIDDAVKSSKKTGISLYRLLATGAQESTYGQEKRMGSFNRAPNQQQLFSAWNADEEYRPYSIERFLADKQIPGVKRMPHYKGQTEIHYEITDKKAVNEALSKRSGLIKQYLNKINSTKQLPSDKSVLDLVAERLVKSGSKGYNPGDKRYESDIQRTEQILRKDPALTRYMKSKKYI